jgi:hypothetical protein
LFNFNWLAFERRRDQHPCRDGAAPDRRTPWALKPNEPNSPFYFNGLAFQKLKFRRGDALRGFARETGALGRRSGWAGLSAKKSRAFDRNPLQHTTVPNFNFFCLAAIS